MRAFGVDLSRLIRIYTVANYALLSLVLKVLTNILQKKKSFKTSGYVLNHGKIIVSSVVDIPLYGMVSPIQDKVRSAAHTC